MSEGMVRELVRRAVRWLVGVPGTPFRFRVWDVVCWWLLVSLVSISFVAEHPLVALTIAISGGALIGVLCVVGWKPLR
jgi:hypothetical protein